MSDSSRCEYFIEKKKRFCRFRPHAGEKYCAEHTGLLGIKTDRKRIVCPLDTKHTCYEDQLSKHLKKCRKQQASLPNYHCEGINGGEEGEDFNQDASKITLQDVPTEELKDLIVKINKLYDEYVNISSEILSHSCLTEELRNQNYGIPAIRHRKQQASIIGNLDKMGLIKDDITYVELGAGKGMLSHWIQKAGENNKNVNFILVDRGTCRYKADVQHKWEDNGPKFERIRIDIEHLSLGKLDTISTSDNPVVAVGKHLCGSATDLALRCVTQTLSAENEDEPVHKKAKDDQQRGKFGGLTIALCCHHRCMWKPYVGKSFFHAHGLSARDFQILCKLSSWAVATWTGWKSVQDMNTDLGVSQNTSCSDSDNTKTDEQHANAISDLKHDVNVLESKSSKVDRISDEVDEEDGDIEENHLEQNTSKRPDLNLTIKEREEIGRKCKRLIDYGRLLYMKDQGINSEMKVYIEEQLTPENIAIIAQPNIN